MIRLVTIVCVFLFRVEVSLCAGDGGQQKLQALQGTVVRKPWSKTFESWNAGGGEYYILDVGDAKLPKGRRSAKEGVILRPSKAVQVERFAEFKGKRVVVRGRFLDGKLYKPANPEEQYPVERSIVIGADGKAAVGPDRPALRGSGFEVIEIRLAGDPTKTNAPADESSDLTGHGDPEIEMTWSMPDQPELVIVIHVKGDVLRRLGMTKADFSMAVQAARAKWEKAGRKQAIDDVLIAVPGGTVTRLSTLATIELREKSK